MRWITRLSYAVGQTQKDLVGSVLNAFVIIYFERCLSIRNAEVGTLLLCGQIVNAISTPLIGYLSDRAVSAAHQSSEQSKTQTKLMRYLTRTTYFEPNFRLRTRKSWHFYGSLLMTIAFPCIFGQPKQSAWLPMWSKLIINGLLIIVVQVGWAAVQIAHLTMLNCLTNDQNERVLLVSLRYFFSSVGDISTFVLSYLLLQGERNSITADKLAENTWSIDSTNNTFVQNVSHAITGAPSIDNWLNATTGTTIRASVADSITINDMPLFRNIALLLTAYGLIFVIAFQCGVPEQQNPLEPENTIDKSDVDLSADDMIRSVPQFIKSLDELHSIASQLPEIGRVRQNSYVEALETKSDGIGFVWFNWFRLARFWVVCFIFTTIRLSVTLANLYISPFLLRTLRLDKSSIMLVPLAIYCTSLITTLLQHRVVKLFGRLGNSLIGVIFTISYCTILFFYQPGYASQLMVYCAAVLLGIGIAFNNVCAIVVVSDMIRPDQMNTAAFVHGFASLTDKIFTGVSVQIIQLSLHWINYRHVEVFIVGSLILIGGSLSVFDYLYWARPENIPQDDTKQAQSKQLQDEYDESGSLTHHDKNHSHDDLHDGDWKKVARNNQDSDPTSHCNGTSQTTSVNV